EFVKIEHTLFALPFVLAGMVVGFLRVGAPTVGEGLRVGLLVLVAATAARTLAMTLNRIVDRRIDARNPRTATRALVTGEMPMGLAVAIAAASGLALLVSAGMLNPLAFWLSPVLVGLFFAYPYMKRVSWLCHLVLGLAFLCAPAGGYLAVTGSFDGWLPPLLLGLAAMAWVAGFDILYALLDVDFDRSANLHSAPADLGVPNARRLSAALHVLTAFFLAVFAYTHPAMGWPMYVAVIAIAALLAYEHATAHPEDPVAINKAFFHVNAVVGWIALAGVLGSLAL
ncbi:MAG TPA: UbiA-like polyprenyltransferase, partial [Candidatus Thermoplasmatota archaeon]|nr:UbiA-like polyprenyltransferase [Candidatus Thermoplasmatota archaeon]